MRALRDHPALAGTTVSTAWRKAVAERREIIGEQARRYPHRVQEWRAKCNRLIAETQGTKRRAQLPEKPQTPMEFARSIASMPPYPLNYLVRQ